MAGLLGFTPEALMGTPDWQDLSPEDRSYVVDQWAIEHKAASPAASEDEVREFNQVVDQFRAAAAPSGMEKVGGFLGSMPEVLARSVVAAPLSIPAYAAEAGGSIGRALTGAEGPEFVRGAPLTLNTGLAVGPTVQRIGSWGMRKLPGEKGKQWDTLNRSLDELRTQILDGDDDPKAVRTLAQKVAIAAAGYNGDDPTGYLYAGRPDAFADPDGFAEAVKEERRPKVVNAFGTREADLRGTRTIHADPENMALAAAFRETRNPAYFQELQKRLIAPDSELRKASLVYANNVPDQEEYEKAWGDLAPMKFVRGALYGQSQSPIDTALSLSGIGGLFRGAKAAAQGGLTLSKIGRGALKASAVEGTSGAASAIGEDTMVTGGEIAESAAAEILGEGVVAGGAYAVGRGVQRLAGRPAAPVELEPVPDAPPFAPEETVPDAGTAAAGLDLPTGPGEIDPSLLPDAPLTSPTPTDPAGTVPETPEALAEQKARVVDGRLPGMIVPGVAVDALPPELQPAEGEPLEFTETPDGTVIHSPDIPGEAIRASQAEGTLMQTLGYATGQKPTTPDAAAVTVRTPEGTEVSAELAAPENVPAALAAAQAKAGPADAVAIEEPASVIEQRLAGPTTIEDLATSPVTAARNVDLEAFRQRAKAEVTPPPAATGPGAASAEEFKPNRFGQRVKSDDRLRESWRKTFEPRKYRPFTEVELQDYANRWIADQGESAASALFLDDASGIDTPERTTLGMQLALRLDQAAAQSKEPETVTAAEVMMDEVVDKLETMATSAGQGLRVFGMWSRMSPQGILRKAVQQIETARRRPGAETPKLTEQQRTKLEQLARRMWEAPEGLPKQDLARELMTEIGRMQGVSVMDVAVAYWYANTLSGPDTHVVNTFGSGAHLLARLGTTALSNNPRDTIAMVRGLAEGMKVGWADAGAAMRGRATTSQPSTKFSADPKADQRNALELIYTPNPQTFRQKAGNVLSMWKYVGRLLTAEDAFWNGTARSAAEYLAASRLARQGVKEGRGDYATLLARELANSPAEAAAALAQAREEMRAAGQKIRPSDLDRRAWQIMEVNRPMEIREEGRRFAEVVTFNTPPEGFWGAVAKGMNNMGQNLVIPTPLGSFPIYRLWVMPFVNVVANVTSMGLDFSPVGIARAAKGRHLVGREERLTPFSAAERRQRMAAGILGTMAIGGLVTAALNGDAEDDPWFDMTDGGPSDVNQKRQLMDQGWKPWSFKFGDTYVSFLEFPGGSAFAGAAALVAELRKAKEGRPVNVMEKALLAGWAVAASIKDRSLMQSVADLFEVLDKRTLKSIVRFTTRPVQGTIPAAGMLRSIARVTDPQQPQRDGMMSHIISGIPVIQSIGTRPALNAFGEPITREWWTRLPAAARFTSTTTKDPEFAWLAEKQLFISNVNDSATVTLANPTRIQKYTVEQIQRERANRLGRFYADTMTPDEAYAFAKAAGPLTREAVKMVRVEAQRNPEWTNEEIQDRLNTRVKAARKIAKLKVLDDLR